jgi:cell division protein FtsN
MTRTENEQEFVLGNKQLLSAFFVVVMLLGVFFAMGYIIGHNSTVEGGAKRAAQAEPAPAPPTPAASSEPVQSATPEPAPPPPQSAAPRETAPAQAEPPRTEAAQPAIEKPAEKAPVKAAVEENEGTRRVQSSPGHIYLQVSAVKRPAADSIVKTLKDKGFPALLGESSKPELFRVLVGPYSETEALSKAKSDLKAIGFDAVVSK